MTAARRSAVITSDGRSASSRHPGLAGHGAAVPRNRWDQLVPPRDHRWTPAATVSVCIPARNARGLSRTLAALGVQTYPMDLLEVVVVDDGSDPPLVVRGERPFDLRIVRSEPVAGFGAGRARNTAAREARGQILVFLDADVVPERQVVEAYARWFERCRIAVPMGLCRFVEMDGMAPNDVAHEIAAGTMAQRFAGHDVDDQSWRERVFERTDDLRIESVDAFRAVIGATLAVSATQFHAVGGFRELGVRGIEDTELGYRLHADGAVLILDRNAQHWHQGRRSLSTEQRAAIRATREPYVQRLLPVPGFRSAVPPPHGPVDTVPVAVVGVVGADGAMADSPRGDADAAVAAAAARIARHCGSDVRLVRSMVELSAFHGSFVTMLLPATVRWQATTLTRITALFAARDVGVIRLLQPDDAPPVTIVRTRALRRALHVRGDDAEYSDLVDCAAELFGAWWAHPVHLDLATPGHDAATGHVPDAGTRATGPTQGGRLSPPRRVARALYRLVRTVLSA